ncbi:MAG: hypothetical protein COB04_12770 [Gammaproteobacteria bacterium]|nr:MAG: hypothetical protein COB04_12770 [Gammaproteobacteria bacterium]
MKYAKFVLSAGFLWLMLQVPWVLAAGNVSPTSESEKVESSSSAGEVKDSVFWHVSGRGIKPSYLLGTIHLSDPEVTRFSDSLNRALDKASLICLELDMSPELMMAAFVQMMAPNQDLEVLLGEALFSQVLKAMSDGNGGASALPIRHLKPWAVMVMLSTPKNQNPSQVMDLRIFQHARARNLPICALETVQEQLAVFDGIPLADQVQMLKETLLFLPQFASLFDRMMSLYKAGALDKLHELNETQLESSEVTVWRDTMTALLDERNLRMIDRIESEMQSHSTLVAVGALHLSGGQGLIDLLRSRGYSVTPIY